MGAIRRVVLSWAGIGMAFRGAGESGAEITLDGDGRLGPSPMETLLLSLASCTGSDIVSILGKMRVPLAGLAVSVEGERADGEPRRYVRIRLRYQAEGVPAEAQPQLERAVALSVDRYCSVLHSLRPDIELATEVVRR